MDNLSAIATARDDGRKEGKEEGKLEERKQLALNMKSKGFDTDTIAQCLNVSIYELQQLLNN